MDKVEKKRQKEQYVVEEMIRLYCRKKHPKEKRQEGQMCPDCQKLSDYAKPEMREQIRQVMRFSGPRMLLYHPVLAIWHLVCSNKEKKK